jgi:radical SAM protein with 4Fe4S-binding SPASM domain
MIEYLKRLGYYPRNVVWELTLACNLRCRHCGSRAGKARDDELSEAEALDVADQLAALGAERVTLSGGEPTLSPYWNKVGKRLTGHGVRVNIISNGKTWTAEHTRMAQEAGLESAAFSLDGLQEVHDRIRKKGSYAEVLSAFDTCRAGGLPTACVSHINKLNLHTLSDMRDLLNTHGVSSWQLQLGNPAGNMADNMDLVIVPKDLLEIVPEVARLRAQDRLPKVFAADNVGYYGEYEKTIRDRGARVFFWVGCRAGCQVLGIESNGNIKGCLSLPSAMNQEDRFNEGNLRERSLTEIWCDDDAFAYNRKFSVDQLAGFCRTCRYNDICRGGCSWTAHSHTGNRFDNPFCYYRVAVEAGVIEP